ncbi:hypothetical protein ACPVPU_04170 [Sphingomonas sp. CJ99]
MAMSRVPILLSVLSGLIAVPANAAHSGVVVRDGFELADAVMFAVVVAGLLIARRALRARFARKRD